MLAAALRTLQVLAATLVAAGEYGIGWVRTLPGRGRSARRARVEQLRGAVLRRAFTRLGPTFIKLGQVMSTRPDLFGPALIQELTSLQDRIPPVPGHVARRQLEEALGVPAERRFREVEDEPLAAASVAQVHRGVLPSGDRVAIKILKPGVRRVIDNDARLILLAGRLVQALSPRARHADLVGHLEHFLRGVREQTDLRREIANYRTFRRNFADVDGVVFPEVHEDLSSDRVMTMALIEGVKIDALPPGAHPDVARILREAFLKMLFEDGFLHADLHPGNLLVTPDGRIAIFDVGMVKNLPDALLEQYIDFNKCLVMGTTADFVSHLRRYHTYAEGSVDWSRLEEDVEAFTAEFRGKPAHEIEFRKLIDHVFDVARRHGIRPVPDMTLMMVGLVTAEGIGKQLDPQSDSFGHVAQYLLPILARRNLLPAEAPAFA
ncbi:MAG: ABC1 kinase family protein [Sandaracinaceae bacterium]